MARPKIKPGDKTVIEKIDEAFWELLFTGDYANVSIRALALQAGVNHNTIYYHYDNIDDLAVKVFNKNLSEKFQQCIMAAFANGSIDFSTILNDDSLMMRWQRFRLYAGSDSQTLRNIFTNTLRDSWLAMIDISYEELTIDDKIDLEFIFNGLGSLIGADYLSDDYKLMTGMMERELGKGIIATFKRLKENKMVK